MSYRGRPSKGCEPCRARKVKCDETKPACNRCTKSGHECKYRDQADLFFRNQTAFAAQKAEGSWRKRSKSHQRALSDSSNSQRSPPNDNTSPTEGRRIPSISGGQRSPANICNRHTDLTDGPSTIPKFDNLTIVQELTPDLRRMAYERFLYDFVILEPPSTLSNEPSDAMWSFIPVLYQRAAEDSCVSTVIHAVAYVNFAHRCNAPQAEALGEECLGRGMTLLSKMIADKKQAATDEALCSVYLMGVYENISIQQRKGTYIAHSNGANALLHMRSAQQYYSNPISARLYEVAYSQMLIFWQQLLGNLHAGKPPSLPVIDIVDVRQQLPSMYNQSGLSVMELIHREAQLHAKWHEMKQSVNPPTSRRDLVELLQAALDLDQMYQSWETTIPLIWRYQMEPNTPEIRATYDRKWQRLVLGGRGAPEEIHSYSDLKRCWVWGFYRTSRIFLLRDLLEILNWMFRLPETDSSVMAPLSPNFTSPFPLKNKVAPVTDSAALRVHHSFATVHLVNVIEKSCSAVLGSFTVPVYGKSYEDVMGMRGYVNLWPLGIMDAVLRSGLVPDSQAPVSPPSTGHQGFPTAMPEILTQNMHHPYQIPLHQSRSPVELKPEEKHLSLMSEAPHEQRSFSHCRVDSKSTPTYNQAAQKKHIYDFSAPHPYDHPVSLPTLGFDITKPKKIDIAARREWINCMLYYTAVELGIKKGMYVPLTERYLPTVKAKVDAALGRQPEL